MSSDSAAVTSSGANARTLGVAKALPSSGFLISTVPVSAPEVPRGRIYARLVLTSYVPGTTPASAAELATKTIAVLWSGYVTPGAISSLPVYPLDRGMSVVVDITEGSNGASTDVVTFAFDLRSKASGATPWIFSEAPGSGPGEHINFIVNVAGTGKDPGGTGGQHVVIAANTRLRFTGASGNIATSATAGNRLVSISIQSAGGVELAGGQIDVTIPASSNGFNRFAGAKANIQTPRSGDSGQPAGNWTNQGTIPEGPWPAGYFWIWNTRNLDTNVSTGDVWSGVRMAGEEWACPIP